MLDDKSFAEAAGILADFYAREFGGKEAGRYRVSAKLVRRLLGRRRLYESDITALSRALLEQGFVLIDMESFYVVMSANAFVNYRRVTDAMVQQALDERDSE